MILININLLQYKHLDFRSHSWSPQKRNSDKWQTRGSGHLCNADEVQTRRSRRMCHADESRWQEWSSPRQIDDLWVFVFLTCPRFFKPRWVSPLLGPVNNACERNFNFRVAGGKLNFELASFAFSSILSSHSYTPIPSFASHKVLRRKPPPLPLWRLRRGKRNACYV